MMAGRTSAVWTVLLVATLVVVVAPCAAWTLSEDVVGGSFEYEVVTGDSLTRVGARFGIEPRTLARTNGVMPEDWLVPGQRLRVDNTHVVPERLDEGIVINVPQRMLFLFEGGEVAAHYPVGLGRRDWPTATGAFTVVELQRDKTWNVPRSIQEEMRREKQLVRTRVPPGPDNPLGRHWIGLSLASFGIHGTIAPASIYHFQSHGCVRMHPDDVADLFERTRRGVRGAIVYSPALLAKREDGRMLLEVHRDVYRRAGDAWVALQALADANDVADQIDWDRARRVVAEREGVARDVTVPPH